MITEFSIKNFFSIKSAHKICLKSSTDIFMSDEYSYEVKEGINNILDILHHPLKIPQACRVERAQLTVDPSVKMSQGNIAMKRECLEFFHVYFEELVHFDNSIRRKKANLPDYFLEKWHNCSIFAMEKRQPYDCHIENRINKLCSEER